MFYLSEGARIFEYQGVNNTMWVHLIRALRNEVLFPVDIFWMGNLEFLYEGGAYYASDEVLREIKADNFFFVPFYTMREFHENEKFGAIILSAKDGIDRTSNPYIIMKKIMRKDDIKGPLLY